MNNEFLKYLVDVLKNDQVLFFDELFNNSFIKYITSLSLDGNQINDQGAEYLAEMLRCNRVTKTLCLSLTTFINYLHLDTSITEPCFESNWIFRSPVSY